MSVVRLLPYTVAEGPHNMAADEVLLAAALAGTASLRFYGWSAATVSLGYFQSACRRQQAGLGSLPYVRRLSGGAALVHHHELTYALSIPAGFTRHRGPPWPLRMHRILAAALRQLGVAVCLHEPEHERPFSEFLCFHHLARGDLVLENCKVVGSARRRRRGAELLHGSILLAASPHTPMLPGIAELSGRTLSADAVQVAVQEEFQHDTAWSLIAGDWTDEERDQVRWLTKQVYTQPSWNQKR